MSTYLKCQFKSNIPVEAILFERQSHSVYFNAIFLGSIYLYCYFYAIITAFPELKKYFRFWNETQGT